MEVTLTLTLPRDELTVPVARHIVRCSMREIGVSDECADAIELALSEACTNVLKHSGPGDEYEMTVQLDDNEAVIRVIDTGHGFDVHGLSDDGTDLSAERGRGVSLMKALVDQVRFVSRPHDGTVVHLEKALEFNDGSLMSRPL